MIEQFILHILYRTYVYLYIIEMVTIAAIRWEGSEYTYQKNNTRL